MQSCRVVVNPSGLWSPGQRFESAQDYKNIFNISFLQSLRKYHIILNCFRANKRQMPSILAVNLKFYFDPLPEVAAVSICNPIVLCQGPVSSLTSKPSHTSPCTDHRISLISSSSETESLTSIYSTIYLGCTIQIRELGSLKAVQ